MEEKGQIEATLADVAARQAVAHVRAIKRIENSDARFEKRMRGFVKLAKIGMRETANLWRLQRQLGRETDKKINALIDSQQRTKDALWAFIGHSGGGRNK